MSAGARKTVVLGGAGFLGLNLAEALLASGDVTSFDRNRAPEGFAPTEGMASAERGTLEAIQADIADETALDAVLSGTDALILAAAITANAERDAADPEAILAVNVAALVPVLRAARRHRVGRIVVASSAAAYGDAGTRETRLHEDTPCDPVGLYALTKFASERLALRLGELWGLDVRVARLTGLFGPWERATGVRDTLSPQTQVMALADARAPVILPRPGFRDWTYAPDAARALAAMTTTKLTHRVYNISAGLWWSVADWAQALTAVRPGLEVGLAEPGEAATVDLHMPVDRAPLDVTRMLAELPGATRSDCAGSARAYAAWWDARLA